MFFSAIFSGRRLRIPYKPHQLNAVLSRSQRMAYQSCHTLKCAKFYFGLIKKFNDFLEQPLYFVLVNFDPISQLVCVWQLTAYDLAGDFNHVQKI